jgi:DNA invertase Pin-like site-specific DNA recombinase
MKIGYLRVSTAEQKLDLQRDALTQAGCEQLYQDVISSTRWERPGLARAVDHLRHGDTFVVWKLDRLGRNVKALTAFIEQLKARGVAFQSLQDGIDTSHAVGQFFFHVLGALAELERSLLVERTQAGLAAARARGRVGGRPRKMTPERIRQAMGMMGVPGRNASAVARTLGITRAVLYRYVQANGTLTPRGQALLSGKERQPLPEQAEAAD